MTRECSFTKNITRSCGGGSYALVTLGLVALLAGILNWEAMRRGGGAELTTSVALFVTAFIGMISGQGHTFTPVAVAVVTAARLAPKERRAGLSLGLTAPEVQSAILPAIITFVAYPALPAGPADPWA